MDPWLVWTAAATPLTMGLLWETKEGRRRIMPRWLEAILLGWLCLGAALLR